MPMTLPVQIVARMAPTDVVATVEAALAEAGIETILRIFGEDANRNAAVAVEIAEAEVAGAHPVQLWIVPPQYLALEVTGRDRVGTARALLDQGPKRYSPRLFVTLGKVHSETPSNAQVLSVDELAALSPDEVRSLFA